jgi:hypothetical protein
MDGGTEGRWLDGWLDGWMDGSMDRSMVVRGDSGSGDGSIVKVVVAVEVVVVVVLVVGVVTADALVRFYHKFLAIPIDNSAHSCQTGVKRLSVSVCVSSL